MAGAVAVGGALDFDHLCSEITEDARAEWPRDRNAEADDPETREEPTGICIGVNAHGHATFGSGEVEYKWQILLYYASQCLTGTRDARIPLGCLGTLNAFVAPAGAARGCDVSLVLENEACAEILPSIGARVQQVTDRRAGRDLLFAVAAADPASDDFLTATTGGWDLLFPNDNPWRGHPDHGPCLERSVHRSRVRAPQGSAELTLDVTLPPCHDHARI